MTIRKGPGYGTITLLPLARAGIAGFHENAVTIAAIFVASFVSWPTATFLHTVTSPQPFHGKHAPRIVGGDLGHYRSLRNGWLWQEAIAVPPAPFLRPHGKPVQAAAHH